MHPLQKRVWRALNKLKIELQYDAAIPLIGTYKNELKWGSLRDITSPEFIAALLTIAKKWKQPVCINDHPAIDELNKENGRLWAQTHSHIHTLTQRTLIQP
jgi:hypothetical protein